MGKYNFDEVIDRHGTDCLKYDFGMKRKGRDDLLPLWVADMISVCRMRFWMNFTRGSIMESLVIPIHWMNILQR